MFYILAKGAPLVLQMAGYIYFLCSRWISYSKTWTFLVTDLLKWNIKNVSIFLNLFSYFPSMACYKDTIRTKKPIKYHVWTTRPTQHHVRTFKTTPCHVRTIIPTNYNYLQLLQIMSGLSDPLHTHMTGLAKLLHEMTFITTFHHKWTIEATSRRWV